MSPRLGRASVGLYDTIRIPKPRRNPQVCPACSFSQAILSALRRHRPPSQQFSHRLSIQQLSNVANAVATEGSANQNFSRSRKELRDSLSDLQKHASNFVNISRLQLALRGLEQTQGDETIRIAILGLADGGDSLKKAKELLRLMVADPLKTEEEWERNLTEEPHGGKPLLLRVGHGDISGEFGQTNRLLQEINISTATLTSHKLEILVMELDPPLQDDGMATFSEAVLVPTIEIPTSHTGRYASISTPVHKSLIVVDGLLGAAKAISFPKDIDKEIISSVADLQMKPNAPLPFPIVDIAVGRAALLSFRESVANATRYEQGWFASGIPALLEWLRSGTQLTSGITKAPVKKLLKSLLSSAQLAINTERTRLRDIALSSRVPHTQLDSLRLGLREWAERAHAELRDQLDIAFNGRRWRKLGWWKLFWRVDDISAIATDILTQRFITEAEKEIVFLAGRIEEAGVIQQIADTEVSPTNWAYKPAPEQPVAEARLGSEPLPPRASDLIKAPDDESLVSIRPQPWPLHIPAARMYLATGTIPALQALAQRLVLQTLTTSSFASIFGGLIYVSSLSATLYEAGAVAALGIVWSLRRMQAKWETAREFWEGEVREEGRKAVRGVETSVQDVLKERPINEDEAEELKRATKALTRAEAAFQAVK